MSVSMTPSTGLPAFTSIMMRRGLTIELTNSSGCNAQRDVVVSVDVTRAAATSSEECQALTYILEAHQWQVTFILGTSHSGINLVAVIGCVAC